MSEPKFDPVAAKQRCPGRPSLLYHECCEAQGKLQRIETEACTCDGGIERPFGCIVHDDASVIARILRGKEGK